MSALAVVCAVGLAAGALWQWRATGRRDDVHMSEEWLRGLPEVEDELEAATGRARPLRRERDRSTSGAYTRGVRQ